MVWVQLYMCSAIHSSEQRPAIITARLITLLRLVYPCLYRRQTVPAQLSLSRYLQLLHCMTRCTPVITHNNNTFHPAHAGGAFLLPCIRHGAGLLFCSGTIYPNTSVYSAFCRVNAIIPPTPQNSAQGFTAAFPAIAPVQPPTIPDRHKRL